MDEKRIEKIERNINTINLIFKAAFVVMVVAYFIGLGYALGLGGCFC